MAAAACTQNHGHIGYLFGAWYLYDMTVDGETPEDFGRNELFFKFQSDLIIITQNEPYHWVGHSYGTWSETENTLTLNFTYSDPQHPAGTHSYGTPAVLGFSSTEPVALSYVEKEKNTMVLEMTGSEGQTYLYYLKRTY